jgi:excisionase family DNA binding protein
VRNFDLVLLTVKQAARVLNVGRSTVYQLIADGRLDVVHIGSSTRVPVDAVTKFVSELVPNDLAQRLMGKASLVELRFKTMTGKRRPHGEGLIRKRPDGRWQGRLDSSRIGPNPQRQSV